MLERAFSLAEKGRGRTTPNPVVGAVIVGQGGVRGEGYHAGPWRDHAEIAAIKDAMRRAGLHVGDESPDLELARKVCAGTTMYVTLEPCCTFGRTPPCTTTLVAAGFNRVVVGVIDPTPAVNGRGIEILRHAGLAVELAEGGVAQRMKRQNDGPRKILATGMPFVTYKYAMTLDGRLSTDSGDSRWISAPESRALVHQWRAWSDAVLIGAGTQQADDPRLTARDVPCERQPLRVVVGLPETLSPRSALVRTAAEGPVLCLTGDEVSRARLAEVESWGVEVAVLSDRRDGLVDPVTVVSLLAERGVQTVLLEGGRRLAGSWWQAGLVDRVAAFICPRIAPGVQSRGALSTSGPTRMEEARALREVEMRTVGPDTLVTGYTGDAF
jgi:diaminohydroxyphosphoribosylaminopyrimidine deaminase / 5-amino-6-(5-phosphoribosylamino)uracil reductase